MRPRRYRAPAPLDARTAFNVDQAFEQRVGLLAGLTIHLTSLADRYEGAIVNGAPAAAVTRVARLRTASESSRDTLVGLALWDRPGIAQTPGEPREAGLGSALTTRTSIGQAQGVVMHRYEVGAGEALEMLLAAARERDITLGQVAREVMGDDGRDHGRSA